MRIRAVWLAAAVGIFMGLVVAWILIRLGIGFTFH
jgi:hypothetical protein